LAHDCGAGVVLERSDHGINAAVRLAIGKVAGQGDGVIVVPSDIPQLGPEAIGAAAEAIAAWGTMAIAAADDGGTNLLACRPAGATPLYFGPRSFERHCRAAAQAGVTVRTLHLPQLLPDIDCPQDLRRFLALDTRTRTHEFLSRLNILDRLENGEMHSTANDHVVAGELP
jgi:2-phospho-L-lactate guanylyltransferase